jgi:phosphoglycerate-specific signal transduction histidine kinase
MGRLTENYLRNRVIQLGGKIEELKATIEHRNATISDLRAENQRLVQANLTLRTGRRTATPARATFDSDDEF